MPPRSSKMKRFIFGFQRRVWWPKCTPASSSSFMETTATLRPFGWLTVRRRARTEPGCEGAGTPVRRLRRVGGSEPANRSGYAAARRSLERLARGRRGSGEREVELLAGERVLEAEPVGVQELALEPEVAGDAVDGSPQTGSPIASRWTRIWCVRPVSSRTSSSARAPSSSCTSNHVTASRGVSVSSERRVRSRRSRPIGASIRPVRDRGAPRTSAR